MSPIGRLRLKIGAAGNFVRDGEILRPLLMVLHGLPSWALAIHAVIITRARYIPALRIPANVTFRRLQAGEPLGTVPVKENQSPERQRSRTLKALEEGTDVFVAEVDGRIVGYAWAAYNCCDIPEVRLQLPLSPDEVSTCRAYVEPAYRFSGIYPGLANFACNDLRQRGIKALFGYTDFTNRHSIRTHEKLGYETVGWACLVRMPLFDLQITRLAWQGQGVRYRVLRRPGRQPRGSVAASEPASEMPRTTSGGLAR
jgi:GNAT superfamily N-acetyltransferase